MARKRTAKQTEDILSAIRNSALGRAVRERGAEQMDTATKRSGDGWSGEVCGACPVQGSGSVGEYSWFFRARYDEWSLDVYAEPGRAGYFGWPADGAKPVASWGGTYGAAFDAGWMKYSEAWALVESSLAAFRRGERPQATRETDE